MRWVSLLLLLSALGCRKDHDRDGVAVGEDCDDLDQHTNPNAEEVPYDGFDNDCDPSTPDDDLDGDGDGATIDCDDADASVHPRAAESCNGVDDDCNGAIDDGQGDLWYADADGDGQGDPNASSPSCTGTGGQVANADDCDDADAGVFIGAVETCDGADEDCDGAIDEDAADRGTFYVDADGDGFGDASEPVQACGESDGVVADDTDCDDTDGEVRPDQDELCNDIDDDCDGKIDDVITGGTVFADADGDGAGDPDAPWTSCDEAPPEYVADDSDCNDANASVTDGTAWYADADQDGFGAGASTKACLAPPGAVASAGDCDDADPLVNPSADETCDATDQDCDGTVDDTALDAVPWYADTDGDLQGDVTKAAVACDPPVGYVADARDCADADAAVFVGAVERCNGKDDDCDTATDEPDAADAKTWFLDLDGDTHGSSAAQKACVAPGGFVAVADDCDDADASAFPGGTEVCGGGDEDCDGTVDESAASDADAWYQDNDGDLYGAVATKVLACEAPAGFVADGTDCDDNRKLSNPNGTEICNAIDDDCDGGVDVGAVGAPTWYLDADGDAHGAIGTTKAACAAPAGYVASSDDCDDARAVVYPGAADDTWNDVDDDCDKATDEDAWLGRGGDGPLTVTGAVDLATKGGVSYAVTAISGATITTSAAPAGIAAGDEVLVMNLKGTDALRASVGTYEFRTVQSVTGSVITLVSPCQELFGETTNANLTGQRVVVQRVPQFTNVTVNTSSSLTAPAWNGTRGGVLAFRATGAVNVASGGSIHVDARGYPGGATGTAYNIDAFQGESYAGDGDGGGAYNNTNGAWVANYGGGGAHITGGGGNYAGGATAGASWNPPGTDTMVPAAGLVYGQADLALLLPGSGGGGVWQGNPFAGCVGFGPGGNGAGVLFVASDSFTANGTNALSATGGTTPYCAQGSFTYGAGGGSGGAVWLMTRNATLAPGSLDALGGLGRAGLQRNGGNGGYGRVRVDYLTVNGLAYNTAAAISALASASDPDPGYVAQRP